jgi:hypothetical protein
VVPPVFVRSGYYEKGKLYLEINNLQRLQNVFLDANLKQTEVANLFPYTNSISLTGDYIQSIEVNTRAILTQEFLLHQVKHQLNA